MAKCSSQIMQDIFMNKLFFDVILPIYLILLFAVVIIYTNSEQFWLKRIETAPLAKNREGDRGYKRRVA